MGKCEGQGKNWHGHVTVLTVAPAYRRLGIAKRLMNYLEKISDADDMYFVDLFVRKSNKSARSMYEGMGYSVYRTVLDYYSNPEEDAYGTYQDPSEHTILIALSLIRYAESIASGQTKRIHQTLAVSSACRRPRTMNSSLNQ